MPQLILDLKSTTDYAKENFFVSESNRKAWGIINQWPDWHSHCLIISGPKHCGKTHLAHIWQEVSNAAYIPSENAIDFISNNGNKNYIINGIESFSGRDNELFHIYNLVKEKGGYLFITSESPMSDLKLTLPDLRSRIKSSMEIYIDAPDDELLEMVISKIFSDKQLRVHKNVVKFIITHMERSFSATYELIEAIDLKSSQEKRNITIPFVKTIL